MHGDLIRDDGRLKKQPSLPPIGLPTQLLFNREKGTERRSDEEQRGHQHGHGRHERDADTEPQGRCGEADLTQPKFCRVER